MKEQLLRNLPKVDVLCQTPELVELRKLYGDKILMDSVRQVLSLLRYDILAEVLDELPNHTALCEKIHGQAVKNSTLSLRPVINGTGIVLHTNLGRACLSDKAAEAAMAVAKRYSTLEYDLAAGRRGSRYAHVEGLLCDITKAESAMVVNNNAAAVLLILSALAQGGEVPVSRGELVEIGGSFRVPEIMEACGAQLKEVGATNKTHYSDYEQAIGSNTKALMKVHTSNYRIVGFTEIPSRSQLVELAHSHNLPFVEDLGSGSLLDLRAFGISDEPTVHDSLKAGVDVVCFSGDKLLGGPQAGIILGKSKYLDVLKKHPLARAMRVDKMTYAALEVTLRSYMNEIADEIPVIAMLSAKPAVLKEKANLLWSMLAAEGIDAEVCAVEGRIGGGAVPNHSMPSYAVGLNRNAMMLEEKLRHGNPPVVGRIHDEQYLLDVRTMWEEDFPHVVAALREAMA